MKKRFFAALLCICLVLALAPAAAQADYAPNPVTIYATIDGQPLKNASISVDIYWFMGNQGIKLDRTEACQTDSSGEALVYVTGKSTGAPRSICSAYPIKTASMCQNIRITRSRY